MGTEDQPLGTEYTSSSPSSTTAAGKLDAGSLGSVFGAGFGLGTTLPQVEENAPDYLFAENYDAASRRSWGERLTFHIGSAYLAGEGHSCALPPRRPLLVLRPCLAGLTTGGSYGLVEGLRTSQGERRRIRINSVLNSMGRRGPGWGNSLGCVGASRSPSLSHPALGVESASDPDRRASPIGVRAPVSNDVLHPGECCLQHSRHGRPSQPGGRWLPHGGDLQDHVGAPAARTSAPRHMLLAPIRIPNPESWHPPRVLECLTDSSRAVLLRAREWRCPRGSVWGLWLLLGLLCPSRSHLVVC